MPFTFSHRVHFADFDSDFIGQIGVTQPQTALRLADNVHDRIFERYSHIKKVGPQSWKVKCKRSAIFLLRLPVLLHTFGMIYAAITAAQAAGERLRHFFGSQLTVNATYAHDIKLAADEECQELIYNILLDRFPKTRCIGEEGDSHNPGDPNAEFEWIVDPIDGTMNLAYNIPHFCVSIAVREVATKKIQLGVIYDPMRNELFTAERGSGTYLNGVRQKVSTRAKLSEAVLAVGFAKSQDSIDHCLKLYQEYGNSARKLRAMGCGGARSRLCRHGPPRRLYRARRESLGRRSGSRPRRGSRRRGRNGRARQGQDQGLRSQWVD